MKAGITYGITDELGYLIAQDEMTIRDLHATMPHLLGLDAQRLTYPYLGLNQRLIGTKGKVRVHQAERA